MLNFTPTQQWISDVVARSLEKQLNTKIFIGNVEVGLFNRVTLHDVVVHDQKGDSLMTAGLISSKIEFLPLIGGEVSLRTVALLDAKVKLHTNEYGKKSNFQFLLDAFKSEEEKEKNNLNLRINSVILRRCNVAYDDFSQPETKGRLNTSHLFIQGLDANVSLKRLTRDSLNLRVRSLSLKEKSGLDIKSLALRLSANRRHCDINHFHLSLPNTHISKENLHADYELFENSNFWRTLNVEGALGDAQFSTDDIVPIFPELEGISQIFKISADLQIKPNVINLQNFVADEIKDQFDFRADLEINRRSGIITGIKGNIEEFFFSNRLLYKISQKIQNDELRKALVNVGSVSFKGMIDYFKRGNSKLKGDLRTDVGYLLADINFINKKISGNLNVDDLNLKKILGIEDLPEKVILSLTGKADLNQKSNPMLDGLLKIISADYRGNIFENVELTLGLKDHNFNVFLNSPHQSADLTLIGNANLIDNKLKDLRLKGTIRQLDLKSLMLTDFFGDAAISTSFSVQMGSLDWKRPIGCLEVNDFKLEKENPYLLKKLKLTAKNSISGSRLNLDGDFGNFMFEGPLSFNLLQQMAYNLTADKLPGLLETRSFPGNETCKFKINLEKSDFFSELLKMPVHFKDLVAEGYLNPKGEQFLVSAMAQQLDVQGNTFSDLRLLLRNRADELSSKIQFNKMFKQSNIRLELDAETMGGTLKTDLSWGDLSKSLTKGSLKMLTEFPGNGVFCKTKVLPTDFTIQDTVWNILPGEFSLSSDSVNIADFSIAHADQKLTLQGVLSKHESDSLVADLKKIDVDYILNLANISNQFSFSGLGTGQAILKNALDSLSLDASLHFPEFYFNNGLMGKAVVRGTWNMEDKRIYLYGDMAEQDLGYTKVRGFVSPAEKCLDLTVYSKNTNTYFLNRYVGNILGEIKGRTTGYCRIHGPFGGIDFEGQEKADINATILATGVRYDISNGAVDMSDGLFKFSNFDLSDNRDGRGILNGALRHQHLKNIRYEMKVVSDDLLVYDKPQSMDMPFYATAYGTGNIELKGKPGSLEADINMRPGNKTVLVYTVDSPESFADVQLLRFADGASEDEGVQDSVGLSQKTRQLPVVENAPMDIRLNFLIDMNPAALLKVVMDRKTGDHLLVHGYGPIRASFYNKGSFEMFGRLNVDRGVYKMSIQDVIRKEFEFTKGSYIDFSGDPFMGDLGLRAIYVVNSASLSDLNIGNSLSENSVRVNCVLNFSGKVKSPQVSFDLELPTVSEDVQQMVRNLISSEEDMNMQILYLLGVGRFYTYNFSSTEAAESQSQSSVAVKSFLSNTLSSQLNNIISNALGSSNWSFGANLSTGAMGWSDMEVEGILSGRLLNNRLLINGNFGYRDRPEYSTTSTNFVGDFDVRYLLTQGGGISLKAYSETNDRYFSKSSLSTQGIGILLKKDFSNLKDLFTFRRKKDSVGGLR